MYRSLERRLCPGTSTQKQWFTESRAETAPHNHQTEETQEAEPEPVRSQTHPKRVHRAAAITLKCDSVLASGELIDLHSCERPQPLKRMGETSDTGSPGTLSVTQGRAPQK